MSKLQYRPVFMILNEIGKSKKDSSKKKLIVNLTWDVENIIFTLPLNLEFMFLGHFSFAL
jgi:hypothetical protein